MGKIKKEKMRPAAEAFHECVRHGNVPEVQRMLSQGLVDPNERDVVDNESWTAFYVAVGVVLREKTVLCSSRMAMARVLLDAGAGIDEPYLPYGFSPLHRAVARQHGPVVEWLLQNKANPNAKDDELATPLEYALERNAWFIVHELLDAGASLPREEHIRPTFQNILQRRRSCFAAARVFFGLLRFRVRILTVGCRFVLPRGLCQQMTLYVWATRRDSELWASPK